MKRVSGSGLDPFDALTKSLARHGIAVIVDVEPAVAEGTFRATERVGEDRLRQLSRSWEAFDRAFTRLEASAERALLERSLWHAFDETDPGLLETIPTEDLAFALPELCRRHIADWELSRAALR